MCVSEFMPNNKSLNKTHLHTLGKNAIDQCNNPERSIAAQMNVRELAGQRGEWRAIWRCGLGACRPKSHAKEAPSLALLLPLS
jgi:hypothetical protein